MNLGTSISLDLPFIVPFPPDFKSLNTFILAFPVVQILQVFSYFSNTDLKKMMDKLHFYVLLELNSKMKPIQQAHLTNLTPIDPNPALILNIGTAFDVL